MTRYEIADLKVDMAVSGRTKQQAAAYAAPALGQPDIVLPQDTDRFLRCYPQIKDRDMAEYIATGAWFARKLLDHRGFQLHASAVTLEDRAYLFSAFSGVGKSTHAEKWIRLFGARCLNDDKPALRLVDGLWRAYGTPWSGKHDLSTPEGAPLGGIAFLRRGEENRISPLSPAQAVPLLLGQVSRAHPEAQLEQLLALADQLLRSVPLWELTCRNDDDAAYISHAAMTRKPVV